MWDSGYISIPVFVHQTQSVSHPSIQLEIKQSHIKEGGAWCKSRRDIFIHQLIVNISKLKNFSDNEMVSKAHSFTEIRHRNRRCKKSETPDLTLVQNKHKGKLTTVCPMESVPTVGMISGVTQGLKDPSFWAESSVMLQ